MSVMENPMRVLESVDSIAWTTCEWCGAPRVALPRG